MSGGVQPATIRAAVPTLVAQAVPMKAEKVNLQRPSIIPVPVVAQPQKANAPVHAPPTTIFPTNYNDPAVGSLASFNEWELHSSSYGKAPKPQKRSSNRGLDKPEITLENLRLYFHLPIVDVAKKFNVCTTLLKKKCRTLGIKRWPSRQIRSVVKSIELLQETIQKAGSAEKKKYLQEIENLREKKIEIIRSATGYDYIDTTPVEELHAVPATRTQPEDESSSNVKPEDTAMAPLQTHTADPVSKVKLTNNQKWISPRSCAAAQDWEPASLSILASLATVYT